MTKNDISGTIDSAVGETRPSIMKFDKLSYYVRLLIYGMFSIISLTWNQSTSPNIAYNSLYCSPNVNGVYTRLWKSKTPVNEVNLTTNKTGTYYCYVTATDMTGNESSKSNVVEIIL